MKKLLLFMILLSTIANAQFDKRSIETKVINGMFGYTNLISNPSCKRNVVGITGSSALAIRNTTSALDGISDCTWDPTATSQTLTYAYDSLPAGLKGQNCTAIVRYLGDASLVKANVQINSINVATDVQLTNSGTSASYATINYLCGDGSTATTLVLTSTGNAANVQYSVYGGPAIAVNSAGTISSNSSSAMRIESIQFGGGSSGGLATSNCSSTPCNIANQSSTWISGVTRGSTGTYTGTIISGVFSAVPYCWGNAGLFGVATGGFANVNATSTTVINVNAYSNAGTTLADNVITLFCMGPR